MEEVIYNFNLNSEYDKIIEGFILHFDSKPSFAHGKTIREAVSPSLWKKIRIEVLKKENYTCSICGYHTEDKTLTRFLNAHEEWEYDEENLILKLIDIKIHCKRCHDSQHSRRIPSSQRETLFEHMAAVNHCDIDVVRYYYKRYMQYDILPHHENKTEEEISKSIKWQLHSHKLVWKFFVYNNIPYYDEVVSQLTDKGLLYLGDRAKKE